MTIEHVDRSLRRAQQVPGAAPEPPKPAPEPPKPAPEPPKPAPEPPKPAPEPPKPAPEPPKPAPEPPKPAPEPPKPALEPPKPAPELPKPAPEPPAAANVAVPSPAANYVDDSGIGHVKVNDNLDWSDVLSDTSKVVYAGSGSDREILIIPAKRNTSNTTDSSFSDSHSKSKDSSTNPVYNLPTGSSDDIKPVDSAGLAYTGSDPVVLAIVGTVLALIAIVSALAVAVYSRRNRERALSEDASRPGEVFIVGSPPEHPVPDLSLLDTDISPDLWLEGQYQYSPNMSQLMNSFNGTAILSDNKTTPMHHRLTVDAFPSSRRGRGGRGDTGRGNAGLGHAGYGKSVLGYSVSKTSARGNSGSRGNSVRGECSILEDISDRGCRRKGTAPIVLYDENSTEERKSNSRRIHNRSRPPLSSQQQRLHYQEQQQQRRRDKFATRRDRTLF